MPKGNDKRGWALVNTCGPGRRADRHEGLRGGQKWPKRGREFWFQNVLHFPALLQMWGNTAEKSSALGKGLALITRAQENLTPIHSSPQPAFEGLRNSVTRPWWNSIFLRNAGFLQNLAEISVNKKKFISQPNPTAFKNL